MNFLYSSTKQIILLKYTLLAYKNLDYGAPLAYRMPMKIVRTRRYIRDLRKLGATETDVEAA